MAPNKSNQTHSAAEIAAQLLLLDAAVIHSLEKTKEALQELLATAVEMRDQLTEALQGDSRAEIDRLQAENAQLRAALAEAVDNPAGEAGSEEVAPADEASGAEPPAEPADEAAVMEEETGAEAADEPDPAAGADPFEESVLPNNPVW